MARHYCDICIVGAGMAGLACATRLAEAGLIVTIIDKARGPGGRMSARRAEVDGETISFDHGAQYFSARDPEFIAAVRGWEVQAAVRRWDAAGQEAYVGIPAMNGPIKAMARDLDVRWNTRAEEIRQFGDRWRVTTDSDEFLAPTVIVAVPAEQASVLLAEPAPELSAIAGTAHSNPCWAVMASFAAPLDIAADTLNADDGVIQWAARNSAKPARSGEECWVIHASPARSRELIDLSQDEVATILLADFFEQTGAQPEQPIHLAAHRWLYSMAHAVAGDPARFDRANLIGIAGDYLHSPRVEGAWLSGTALAEQVLAPG